MFNHKYRSSFSLAEHKEETEGVLGVVLLSFQTSFQLLQPAQILATDGPHQSK